MTSIVINTLGRVLNNLADKVFDGIQKSIESHRLATLSTLEGVQERGLMLQIEAGRQVRLAIENCKNSYVESLDVTINKLSPEIQKNLGAISQLVDDILNPKMDVLLDVASRVEQLILRSPFIQKGPYVYKNTPSFIAHSKAGGDILVRFFGHFPIDQKLAASFSIGQNIFSPVGDLTYLVFKVPYHHFCPLNSQEPSTASLAEGELKLSWIKDDSEEYTNNQYKIWIAILPSTPGKISVEYAQPITETEKNTFSSPEYFQSSGMKGGGLTIPNKAYSVSPEEGWKVVRGSSNFLVIEKRPKNSLWSFVSDDRDQVIYNVTTTHVPKKDDSGQIKFKIQFNQYRNITSEQVISEDLLLKWGETKVIDEKKGVFKKVVFTSFDGLRYEISGVNSSNPFLKIKNEGGHLVLSVVSPETLSFFSRIPSNRVGGGPQGPPSSHTTVRTVHVYGGSRT